MLVVFDFYEKPLPLEVFNYLLTTTIAVHAGIWTRLFVHHALIIHHPDRRQPMPLADFKIVWIVGWGYFQSASAKLPVNILICNHRQLAV